MLTYAYSQEDAECPLCLEEMDISDLNFKPCPCGYQVSSQYSLHVSLSNPETPGLDLSFLLASYQGESEWSLPCL